MMKYVTLVFAVLMLSGCQTDAPVPTNSTKSISSVSPVAPKSPKLGESFEMQLGEWVSIDDGRLSFQFDSVAEDSRCPSGPGRACFWAGNAVVVLKFKDGSKASLNTYLQPHDVVKGGYTISLLSLSPYPTGTKVLAKGPYRAEFVVRRN